MPENLRLERVSDASDLNICWLSGNFSGLAGFQPHNNSSIHAHMTGRNSGINELLGGGWSSVSQRRSTPLARGHCLGRRAELHRGVNQVQNDDADCGKPVELEVPAQRSQITSVLLSRAPTGLSGDPLLDVVWRP